jgi:RNA polymerase sigma-70 factor, ECF subfamily
MDDPDLVEAARKTPEAFGVLYQRYLPRVYRYLYRRLGGQAEAEDVTAQVFIEALEGLARQRFRKGGCFAAWLFTIARRRCVDVYRRKPVEALADPPALEPGLLALVEQGEDLTRLARLVARLDEERQELLRMRFSAELSFAEIGQIEGRSEAAVKMALYRTLEGLRAQWEVENG